jgi:hypothetical protein
VAEIGPIAEIYVPLIVLGVVLPIVGGEARYVANPEPLTVEEADKVVKEPVLGVEEPMAGGEAK